MLRILLPTFLLAACSDQGLNVTRDDPKEIDDGTISGRVCDPSGRTWLEGALAYVNLRDDDGVIIDTVKTYSDIDGRYTLADLTGEQEYEVRVEYGPELIFEEQVWLESGGTHQFEEPDCFDPVSLDIAIVTGDYDNFDVVLDYLGFVNYETVNGQDGDEIKAFLADPAELARFDIIFFNGGFVEDGVIYNSQDPDDTMPAQAVQNVVDYVEAGGVVFGSDWAYDLVEKAWPDRVDWVGADDVVDDAQKGDYEQVNAAVSDRALSEFLGTDYLDIQYDLPVWPPIESVSTSVSAHLAGNVPYSDGLSEYTLTGVPLLVSFNAGSGRVVFSTFRVVPNSNDDMLAILQYMMYNL